MYDIVFAGNNDLILSVDTLSEAENELKTICYNDDLNGLDDIDYQVIVEI